ncbi:hypothetical protein OTU49_006618 [Cherax quadricarinatus]|uniref:HAUS augmin-like complex subunit 4 n=1 Tax=Cherax quadricarinatus TaxID=27406 RepID=A0AAW0X1F9_CHEQU|nr:uncharacterized protein LOC128699203 [Cherax quadricarinatus]XP_053647770.1 uncharacterized protein LOC128699203 [Cherax quadricarinatus]XP_053647771.1 uncharacterized protein LOC128699203 [Cherax quadricarinatus]XP_053647772.1 uncharacterized protein LOC128699203 [Cherax quadricarinatus]XP_053647773.1 uncharacterized protein LOC128699203 [Cherax quadricarinatus]XP_053647774.1 uncharacterized protein LOC128699203 [Cherax quadricarinatus]XP_053647775.1 uncharacterized protein LOC128699203 [
MESMTDTDVSTEALASKLSGSLPVYIGAHDVKKFPQLAHLLEDLSSRLTPTGIYKTTHAKLMQAAYTMKHARQLYIEVATLHRVVHDALYETSTLHETSSSYDKTAKNLQDMLEALTLSELEHHLMLVQDSSDQTTSAQHQKMQQPLSSFQQSQHTVFGITPEQVLARAQVRVSDKMILQLAKVLEERIEKEWIRIASFLDPVEFVNYDPDEVSKIPDRLEDKARKLTEERLALIHSMRQTDYLFQQVYCLLLKYSKILQCLVEKQRLSCYPAQHLLSGINMHNVQLMKLKCMQLEIMVDTYNSQSVPALKLIQAHLEDRKERAQKTLALLQHKLSSYSGLDSRYQELLEEYSKLQQDINFTKKSMEECSH